MLRIPRTRAGPRSSSMLAVARTARPANRTAIRRRIGSWRRHGAHQGAPKVTRVSGFPVTVFRSSPDLISRIFKVSSDGSREGSPARGPFHGQMDDLGFFKSCAASGRRGPRGRSGVGPARPLPRFFQEKTGGWGRPRKRPPCPRASFGLQGVAEGGNVTHGTG